MTTGIVLTSIVKSFTTRGKPVRAVRNVSLSVKPGEFVVLQGPSGCGKTTVLLMTGGLLKPDEGLILVAGENPYTMTPRQRDEFRARSVGFVFQQFYLVPYLSVIENIALPSLALPGKNGLHRAEELMDRFNLSPRRDHLPGELSTGECQRTALARALYNKPRVVLADEPTGNLDEKNARGVLEHLKNFSRAGGSVLLVTHDSRAGEYGDRHVSMESGECIPA